MDFYNSNPIMQNQITKITYFNNKIYMDDKFEPILNRIKK